MYPWPNVELTEFERKSVSLYESRNNGKPGVLRRTYRLGTFCTAALPDIGQTAPKLRDTLAVSRRSRVFGLEFGGDTWAYYLKIQSAAGELYTAINNQELADGTTPPEGCLVSSMTSGTIANAEGYAQGPLPFLSTATNFGAQSNLDGEYSEGAALIEPNIVLLPNTTLQFSVTLAPSLQVVIDNPDEFDEVTVQLTAHMTLLISAHVWEFPGMLRGMQNDAPGEKGGA